VITPPTDNLYKFMAIAGVILMIGPWFIILPEYRAVTARTYEVQRQHAALEGEIQRGEAAQTLAQKRADDLAAKQPRTAAEDEELKQLAMTQSSSFAEVRAKTRQLGLHQEETSQLLDDVSLMMSVGAATSAAGVLLATAGFALWYFRLQRYEDRSVATGRTGQV
jgi:hypothetical protein